MRSYNCLPLFHHGAQYHAPWYGKIGMQCHAPWCGKIGMYNTYTLIHVDKNHQAIIWSLLISSNKVGRYGLKLMIHPVVFGRSESPAIPIV